MLFLCLLPCVCALGGEESKHFYTLNVQNGLSSNHIQQMLQLHDSRMVVMTDVAVDVYDGVRFTSIPVDGSVWVPLSNYQGELHLFADSHDRIWAKRHKHLYCFNLRTMQQEATTPDFSADDFFIDANGETWTLNGGILAGDVSGRHLNIKSVKGLLQDVEAIGDSVMLFFDTGRMCVYGKDGSLVYRSDAYDEETAERYRRTSLVVCGLDGCIYQVRTGPGGAILQTFDPKSQKWTQLLTSEKSMHTLTATPTGWLYLTTPDGYLRMKPSTGESEAFHDLYLPDGTALATGINTVHLDREGGVWLGSYNNGILYTSPLSGIFDTHPIDIEVYPILTTIFLHGRPVEIGKEYDGRILLNVAPPYADDLTLDNNQNSLAFQFSTMNCVRPRSTCYRYKFSKEKEWHTVSADSIEHLVDDKGVFYLPLVGLSPGEYTLEVMATTNPTHWNPQLMRSIRFTILPPWWQTPVFYVLYVLLLVIIVTVTFLAYRHRLQRKNREEMLLLRIQNLVEQVNRYEHSEAMVVLSEPDTEESEDAEPEPTQQEKEFMERATRLVEQHMSDPLYNVEHLAADLCMERTGLYKKLIALMQQSPVAFIRSIRLHRAAAMLQSGDKSIADVAMLTGFSSPSYFSKCFQKEFGCKPSEYAEN